MYELYLSEVIKMIKGLHTFEIDLFYYEDVNIFEILYLSNISNLIFLFDYLATCKRI